MRRLPSVWDEAPDFSFLPTYTVEEREAICRASALAISGVTPGSWPRELLTVLQLLATKGYDFDDVNDILQHLGLIPTMQELPPYVWAYILTNPAVGRTRLQLVKERMSRTALNPEVRIRALNELLDTSINDLAIVRTLKGKSAKQTKSRKVVELEKEFVTDDEEDEDVYDDSDSTDPSSSDLVMMAQYTQTQTGLVLKIMGQLGVEQKNLQEWHLPTDTKGVQKLDDYSVTELVGGHSKQVSKAPVAITSLAETESAVSVKEVADKSLIVETLTALVTATRAKQKEEPSE